ncbi:MAG: hypothetical protein ACOX5Z_06795 [Desulfobulbus sp.]|jgi:hypothetical protein
MNRFALFLWLLLLPLPCVAVDDTCPLERAIYEDLDGSDFRLEFAPPTGNAAEVVYSATITHPERGVVFRFDLGYAMGNAQPYLRQQVSGEDCAHHNVHFFDKDLRTTDPDPPAPQYLLIEGLGPADWYGTQAEHARRLPIGTPLWKLAGCRGAEQGKAAKK